MIQIISLIAAHPADIHPKKRKHAFVKSDKNAYSMYIDVIMMYKKRKGEMGKREVLKTALCA